MRVNTNFYSLVAQRNLKNINEGKAINNQRLSSGERAYRAAEDPSGLAISEKLKAKIVGMQRARKNANDSISLIQLAEGTLGMVQDISVRLKEMALHSSSDTIGNTERIFANRNFQALKSEIKRVTDNGRFMGNRILKENNIYDLQIGVGNKKEEDRVTFNMQKIFKNLNTLGIDELDILSKDSSRQALDNLDKALEELSGSRAWLGSTSNRMNSIITTLDTSGENAQRAKSQIQDSDVAKETAARAKEEIREQATAGMLDVVNKRPTMVLDLLD